MGLNKVTAERLASFAHSYEDVGGDEPYLEGSLRLLAKWRSQILSNTIVARDGTAVQTGPFAGMQYVGVTSEGGAAPRLLGTYENELHPAIETFLAEGLDEVVDVGCADGYYAVGFARRLPGVLVHARDIDEEARRLCVLLAQSNGVGHAVRVGGEWTSEDFAAFAGRRTLVFMDVEGAEDDLLDPALQPALAGFKLIVETHPSARPGVTERLARRFKASHHVEVVYPRSKTVPPDSWLVGMETMDQFMATWEWRHRPTPWLIMRPRNASAWC